MREVFIKHSFGVLLVLFSSFLAGRYLFKSGYFPIHDDIQAFRLLEMDKCIKDGQIPCRWIPDMGYGYGYPQFNYYAPLPYYIMEVFHLLGFGFLDSTKIGFFLSILFSGLGMYLFANSFFGRFGGVVAALFYIWAPYRAVNIFVRGAMGESWGMAFLPFVFWSARQVISGKDRFYFLWLSLSIFGVFTSHNVTALIFIPFFVVWVIFISISQKKSIVSSVLKIFWPSLWGVLMSSFFTLPAFFEKKYVHIETMFMGYFNYLAHFVGLKQLLFSTKFGYGASVWGDDDGMLLTVGIFHWAIPLLVFLFFVFGKNKYVKSYRKVIILFFVLGVLSLFMIHPRSGYFWKIIPVLYYLQFPWRFLLTASFFFSFVAGGLSIVILDLKRVLGYSLIFIVCLAVVSFNFSYFKPEKILPITDSDKFSGSSWEKQLTISIFDYLPKSAKYPPTQKAPDVPLFLSGEGLVLDGEKGTNWQKWRINIESERAEVVFPVYNYPIWKAWVNGNKLNVYESGDLGLVTVSLVKGESLVNLRLEDTLVRRFSNYLSLFSFFLILPFIFVEKRNFFGLRQTE